jgi:hypothetical protein
MGSTVAARDFAPVGATIARVTRDSTPLRLARSASTWTAVAALVACSSHPAAQPAAAPAAAAAAPRPAATEACNQATLRPVVHVDLPAHPFQALPTLDGCWIFVSLFARHEASPTGLAVVRRSRGAASLARVLALEGAPSGMVLTRDGEVLVLAAGDRVLFLDIARLISGQGDPMLGHLDDGPGWGRIYVNLTPDEGTLFVSDEKARSITVVDFARARSSGFSAPPVIGKIPVGELPIALTLSADGRHLFTTSQRAPPALGWPLDCVAEGAPADAPPTRPKGAIIVIDVARAKSDPPSSVVAVAAAGCGPVRLVLSPAGDVAYVTARASHQLLAFDSERLVRGAANALVGAVPVGTAPVGVAVIDEGKRIVVASSNRFHGTADDKRFLAVVDARRLAEGRAAVVGSVPAGAFPRELARTGDARTLLLTNFASRTLQLVDLARVPLEAPRP